MYEYKQKLIPYVNAKFELELSKVLGLTSADLIFIRQYASSRLNRVVVESAFNRANANDKYSTPYELKKFILEKIVKIITDGRAAAAAVAAPVAAAPVAAAAVPNIVVEMPEDRQRKDEMAEEEQRKRNELLEGFTAHLLKKPSGF